MFIYKNLTLCNVTNNRRSLPKSVADQFNSMKKDGQSNLALKVIHGNYYVYKEHGIWLKREHRNKTISEYLGRITSDGHFIKKSFHAKNDLESAKALIAEHGGEIIWHEKLDETQLPAAQYLNATDIDLKLLMVLSMNARLSSAEIAKIMGLSEQAAYSRVKAIEKKFGITYLLEVDVEKLGYIRYLILIKFEDGVPTKEEIEEAIKGEYNIQFAAVTKGDYDVVMYVIDESPLKAYDNLLRLRQKGSISKYKGSWIFTNFAQTYSFMPLREEFIENVVKEKVWHRTKDTPRLDKDELRQREFLLLKELNNKANATFASIDEKCNFNKGTSRYAYHALKERGIVTRPTISMTNLPIKYVGVILLFVDNYKVYEDKRYKFLIDLIKYGEISNKYCLSGNIGAPVQGAISFMPVAEEGYLDKVTAELKEELTGGNIRNLVITEVIVGTLCYRRFDDLYSRQYRLLVEFEKIMPARPTFYG